MPSAELERLVASGLLQREAFLRAEFVGLLRQAEITLRDSANEALAMESRFRLAYGAAHAVAVAALRLHGYRPQNRQIAFQALAHTLNTPVPIWRLLARSHEQRNRREYEGLGEVDARSLRDLIHAAGEILAEIRTRDLPEDAE